jgi:hypothetical protein
MPSMGSYFIHGICVVVVNDVQLDGIRKLQHWAFLDGHDVGHGYRYLHTVAFIVRPEYYLLERFNPLLGTGCGIRSEIVFPLICLDGEGRWITAVNEACLDPVSEINVACWEVMLRRVGKVGQNVALQDKPIPRELDGGPSAFGEIAGLGGHVL